MLYVKNNDMEYISMDESSLAVFNPESRDTHLFDEIGIDILTILDEPCDLEVLLEKLCSIYHANVDDIRSDVEEFLTDTISKGIVKAL